MSTPQNLSPLALGPPLKSQSYADVKPIINPSDERYIWLDSSLALEHGLDLVDLEVEVVSPVTQTPPEKG